MSRKGFTLIELLIVVVIIGILAAIAVPKLQDIRGKSQVAAMKTDLRNMVSAMENFFDDNGYYPNAGATADTVLDAQKPAAFATQGLVLATSDASPANLTGVRTSRGVIVQLSLDPDSTGALVAGDFLDGAPSSANGYAMRAISTEVGTVCWMIVGNNNFSLAVNNKVECAPI
jgi:prepilin-type N-terminal cleavage/methylation domain-containing protein